MTQPGEAQNNAGTSIVGTHDTLTHKRIDPFHHPDSGQVDYERLIAALRECREQVEHLRTHTGIRNPVYREAEALIAQVDAVAALSRVPDAVQRVSKRPRGHSTSVFGEV